MSRWTTIRNDEVVTLEIAWNDGGIGASRADVEAWFGDHLGRETLLEIARALGRAGGLRTTTDELVSTIAAAIDRGDLRVDRRSLEAGANSLVEEEPERPAERPLPVEEKTWIAIRLVDDSSPPKPLAFKRYKVELPDGSTRTGMLDDKGAARIEGIDPGQCQVSFPDLDPNSWARQ
jgi:hypothetical protein